MAQSRSFCTQVALRSVANACFLNASPSPSGEQTTHFSPWRTTAILRNYAASLNWRRSVAVRVDYGRTPHGYDLRADEWAVGCVLQAHGRDSRLRTAHGFQQMLLSW